MARKMWVKSIQLLLIVVTMVALTGCESGECREPQDLEESGKRFDTRVNGWLDAAGAYDLQRETVHAERQTLKKTRVKVVREREKLSSQMIDELISPQPDTTKLKGFVYQIQKVSMTHGWKLFDVAFRIHKIFTTEQRQKIVDAMREPQEPFSTPFLARRAIDYVLFKIDADKDQKAAVNAMIVTTEKRVNQMLTEQRTLSDRILAQWVVHKPEIENVRQDVNSSSDGIVKFALVMIDDALVLRTTFRPEQQTFVNDRMRRMKVCTENK